MAGNQDNDRQPDKMALSDEEVADQELLAQAWDELSPKVQERMLAIRDLRRKGIANSALSKLLNCSERTISRDIQRWQELFKLSVDRFQPDERIGESIAILKEIRDRCLATAEELMSGDDDGLERVNSARGFLHEAAMAEREINSLLKDVGMMKVIPRRIEIGGYLGMDIRSLGAEQLREAISHFDRQIEERESRIARLQIPCSSENESS